MMSARFVLVSTLLCTLASIVQSNAPVNLGCSDSTNYKWINLVRSHSLGICSYEIRPYNVLVCQLRVEFSTDLPPPIVPSIGATPTCQEGSKIKIGAFEICGSNQKQHLYLPFDGSDLSNTEIITSDLTKGSGSYRIKVTQIECPFGIRRSFGHLSGYGSWSNNWHNSGASLSSNNVLYDAYQVAPESCDQYHMSSRGVVESLNYNAGKGGYPRNSPLKVCFKTPQKSKVLRLTGLDFDLEANVLVASNAYGADCFGDGPGFSNDYITIPSSTIIGKGLPNEKYCGTILKGQTVESSLYETAHFNFHSGEFLGLNSAKRVYRFKYEVH